MTARHVKRHTMCTDATKHTGKYTITPPRSPIAGSPRETDCTKNPSNPPPQLPTRAKGPTSFRYLVCSLKAAYEESIIQLEYQAPHHLI